MAMFLVLLKDEKLHNLKDFSMIGGMILSAGESSRMGEPKALLKIGNTLFINHLIEILSNSGITNIVTILGHNPEIIAKHIDKNKCSIRINSHYKKGQLSSIITGVDYFEKKNVEGVIICLVDHPLINADIITALVDNFTASGKKIIVPVFKKKRGHPVIFSRVLFQQIRNASPEIGLRQVLWQNEEEICEVEMENENILVGINTPEEYRQYIKL